MHVTYTCKDGNARIRLLGEIDHHAARQISAEIGRIIDTHLPRSCTLDLSGVTFMDSSGIAVLLRAKRRAEEIDGSFSVEGAGPQIKRVMQTTGLARLISIR
ncbi:STAS domain-containing protein [Papillibacter cinnamivorans]|uniref:Anti-sigma factor antagonist n=1 Tax=Papillibacter cinnamivorans DSM 12816 TaxID=1122930 RepID=A0A1W1ZI29_9FIRM|nr:STAS domain-containing protein [Papillibacter cinnamivorans]SMC47698.1 stage II sporulation protein AA (anti-sigma F factor antagonist) [Papillibacter cinnamivorans DSM 12816]